MVCIKTTYPKGLKKDAREVMADSCSEPLLFKDEAQARQFLKDMGWDDEFINSCEYPTWTP